MADIVKQGIVKAAEDLEKENQEKLMQEVRNFKHFFTTLMLFTVKIKQLSFGESFGLISRTIKFVIRSASFGSRGIK